MFGCEKWSKTRRKELGCNSAPPTNGRTNASVDAYSSGDRRVHRRNWSKKPPDLITCDLLHLGVVDTSPGYSHSILHYFLRITKLATFFLALALCLSKDSHEIVSSLSTTLIISLKLNCHLIKLFSFTNKIILKLPITFFQAIQL